MSIFCMILFSLLSFPSLRVEGANEEQLPKEPTHVIFGPREEVEVFNEVFAKILFVHKQVGDFCAERELLIELDSELYKARQDAAEAAREAAETSFKNKIDLSEDGLTSKLFVKEAKLEFYKAGVNYTQSQRDFSACFIRAPYDCHVAEIRAHPHEYLQSYQPLIKLVYDKVLLAKFLIPSEKFEEYYPGKDIVIVLNETGEELVTQVSHVDSAINAANSTIRIYAEIPNFEWKWRVGMSGYLKE